MPEIVRIEIPETTPVTGLAALDAELVGVDPANIRIYHFDDGSTLRVFCRRPVEEFQQAALADALSSRSAEGSMLHRPDARRGREVHLEDAPAAAEVQAIG